MQTFSPRRRSSRERFIVGNYRERRVLESKLASCRDFSEEWGGYFYFFDEFLQVMKKENVRNDREFDSALICYLEEEIESSYIGDGEIIFHPDYQKFVLQLEAIISRLYHYIDLVDGFRDIHQITFKEAPRSAVLIIIRGE